MEKETLIQLTSDLYKLTLLFPKKEPLRCKIRELADDILANYISKLRFDISRETPVINLNSKDNQDLVLDLETIDGFLTIAREQNWVSFSEVLKVSEKYVSLRKELEDIDDSRQRVMTLETVTAETGIDFDDLSKSDQRRDMILKILKEKDKAQVWEFKKVFPKLTKRTLRRDFEKLLGQGLVERVGERNQTFYKLKSVSKTVLI